MAEQLAHLQELADQRPNIVVKIVLTGTEYYAACPFMIARIDGKEIAFMDALLRGKVVEAEDDVTEVIKTWEGIREVALPSKESLEMIGKAIESWKSRVGESRPVVTPTEKCV